MLYLIRYGELALKTRNIRTRFEQRLVSNIEDQLIRLETSGRVSREWGRIYLRADEHEKACEALSHTFGITSFSPCTESTSKMEEICIEAVGRMGDVKTGTFAVRARRTGTHKYTSQDVGAEAGAAILKANSNLKVDLTNPDTILHIEVRDNRSFFFRERIPGPGGLPMGSQGKVIALIEDERGIGAAWLLMKRGCKVHILADASKDGSIDVDVLFKWDPYLKVHDGERSEIAVLSRKLNAKALVFSTGIEEIPKLKAEILEEIGRDVSIALFYPLAGMDDGEVKTLLNRVQA